MFFLRSATGLQVRTPAKVNLYLELLARRADGFHELETVMAAVDLFDTLHFQTREDSSISVECRWATGQLNQVPASHEIPDVLGDLPPSPQNLVTKALVLLQEATGCKRGAIVRLVKRIPSAAGLGGASSNAAAVLLAANECWKLGLSLTELSALAAQLGSDIPFFLRTGSLGSGLAVCRGRGEIIEPLKTKRPLQIVIVRPYAGLSTAKVFQQCELASQPKQVEPLLAALQSGAINQIGSTLFNRLQQPARQISSTIDQVAKEFEKLDVVAHQMSGSGTSYFGICKNVRHARRVTSQLKSKQIGTVFQTQSVGINTLCN
ncbi:MAG: 4-(cytidine 5'-diphospho)-2-C-methyl-D-erythritol kinase [Blastopirellula sp.]|nr:MAG: 4-(cytidine 5'-diphospho)-2-C-methyl-D-erythritol kinase [Blastopirellula sp.]